MGSGCDLAMIVHDFTMRPRPRAQIAAPDRVCAGGLAEFKNLAPNDLYTYVYDYGDGSPLDSASIDGRHVYANGNTTLQVTLTVTDLNGCSAMATAETYVVAKPNADFRFLKNGQDTAAYLTICEGIEFVAINLFITIHYYLPIFFST